MLNEEVVLSARNISKKYLTNKSRLFKKEKEGDAFWALKDINFDLKKGEILGIIGLNGAGKSTLLKILSEVIPPTTGEIEYTGSILSILEIGTGFHPDLSGYDNIFLNASILGMKKEATLERVDEIIDFSGIRDSIYEPVKTYSNGMYLRLALSIALFTDNEILLLDEVIAVGDVEFRYKGIQKIKEQAREGKSCIIISHDMNSIVELCDNCILLEKGKLIYHKKSKQVVDDYYNTFYQNMLAKQTQINKNEVCDIISVEMEKNDFYMDESIRFIIRFELLRKEDLRIVLKIRDYQSPVMTDSIAYRPEFMAHFSEPGVYETSCSIPANLFNAGNYFVDIILGSETALFLEYNLACRFKVLLKEWERNKIWNMNNESIPFRPICNWETISIKK